MWLTSTIKLGVKNLLLHRLRSLLTALGVILGVMSMIVMLAIGEGSKREALEQIRSLGARNIIIRSVKPSAEDQAAGSSQRRPTTLRALEYGLKYDDVERLRVLPTIERTVPASRTTTVAQQQHRQISEAQVVGTTPIYLPTKHLKLARGRFLTNADLDTTANVAVLSASAGRQLFSYTDPLGKTLFLGPSAFLVVGVLAPFARTADTAAVDDVSSAEIYIPLTTARDRFGELKVQRGQGAIAVERTQLSEITLTANTTQLVSQTASMARRLLQYNHPTESDFELHIPLDLLRRAEQEKRIWNLVLGSVASISLLVGGIGIMNIMLANITERTREIGVRRALGATRRDITVQFLVETVVLSATGGIMGVLFGVTVPMVISYFTEIETIVRLWTVLLAAGISVMVGIVFGLYPARRAALMEPIEALRHE